MTASVLRIAAVPHFVRSLTLRRRGVLVFRCATTWLSTVEPKRSTLRRSGRTRVWRTRTCCACAAVALRVTCLLLRLSLDEGWG